MTNEDRSNRRNTLNFICWERKMYLKHSTFIVPGSQSAPLSRGVHDSCKAEAGCTSLCGVVLCRGCTRNSSPAVVLGQHDGRRPVRSLLWLEQQPQRYVPLIARVVSIDWALADNGLVAFLFTFQGMSKCLSLLVLRKPKFYNHPSFCAFCDFQLCMCTLRFPDYNASQLQQKLKISEGL